MTPIKRPADSNQPPLLQLLTVFLLSGALLALSGCGFKIRSADIGLPFQTIAVEGNEKTAQELRFMLNNQPGVDLVEKSTNPQVVVQVVSEDLRRTVVTFNSAGRPREIELRLTVIYRVVDSLGVELTAPQEIVQARDISVNESEALAFSGAEDFMLTDMQSDIAYQLLRRLRSVKLETP
jgi:LPS-assembly lipoprotein